MSYFTNDKKINTCKSTVMSWMFINILKYIKVNIKGTYMDIYIY